jgi:hypothetical protein
VSMAVYASGVRTWGRELEVVAMEGEQTRQRGTGILLHPSIAPPGSMKERLPSAARTPKSNTPTRAAIRMRARVEAGLLVLI